MDKKYQVFVSSTYADLKDERSKVIQTLMEMDCIPSGMELFPATDEEQWNFIKRVIDDCDYYLLIVGGRYGTTDSTGLSYTEKEYDYAVEKGIKVIALLHENPEELPGTKIESNPEFKNKLLLFREKVSTGRIVKFWSKPEELSGIVALSLQKTIKMFPAIGWVRANQVSNEDSLKEIIDLSKHVTILKEQLSKYQNESIPKVTNIASLEENINIQYSVTYSRTREKRHYNKTLKWKELFGMISPYIMVVPKEDIEVSTVVAKELYGTSGNYQISSSRITDDCLHTIKVQFIALELIFLQQKKYDNGIEGCTWSLTPNGKKLMVEIRTIKSNASI